MALILTLTPGQGFVVGDAVVVVQQITHPTGDGFPGLKVSVEAPREVPITRVDLKDTRITRPDKRHRYATNLNGARATDGQPTRSP